MSAQTLVAALLTLITVRLWGKLNADYVVVVVPCLAVFSVAGPLVVGVLAALAQSASLAVFFASVSLLFLAPGLLLKSAWAIPCLAIGFSFVPTLLNIHLF